MAFMSSKTVPDLAYYRARITGRREAVLDFENQRRYTFGQIEERSSKLAAFLLEKLGLKKGDRIAFCAENSIAYIDAFFMSYKTGIIMTSYNYMMGEKEIQVLLKNETPRVIFYSERQKKLIEHFRHDGSNREYICIMGEPDKQDKYTYEDIMAYEPDGTAVFEPPRFDDINMLIHT